TTEKISEEDQEPPLTLLANNPPAVMAERAIAEAAEAINTLAAAFINGGAEKNVHPINFFNGDGTQDPLEWYSEFKRAAVANRWNARWKLELVPVYLKGITLDWFASLTTKPTAFSDKDNADTSFKHMFLDRFV